MVWVAETGDRELVGMVTRRQLVGMVTDDLSRVIVFLLQRVAHTGSVSICDRDARLGNFELSSTDGLVVDWLTMTDRLSQFTNVYNDIIW